MDFGILLLLQSIFDLILLIVVLALYYHIRKLRKLPLEETIEQLKKANQLCEEVSHSLAESKSKNLISSGTKKSASLERDVAKLKKEVSKLVEKGLGTEDIAQKLGIQEGEVVLLLSLNDKQDQWKG